jgi:hypothetical protein
LDEIGFVLPRTGLEVREPMNRRVQLRHSRRRWAIVASRSFTHIATEPPAGARPCRVSNAVPQTGSGRDGLDKLWPGPTPTGWPAAHPSKASSEPIPSRLQVVILMNLPGFPEKEARSSGSRRCVILGRNLRKSLGTLIKSSLTLSLWCDEDDTAWIRGDFNT